MSVILGSARSDYSSPKAGDQSGKEVSTQPYYTHAQGYWLGFEPISKSLGEGLAKSMKDACDNNNFGYSQPYRMTGRQAVVQCGSIKKVNVPCCVDCSSLVNLCLYENGHNVANFNTASEPSVLRKTGLFREIKVSKESDIKKVGTILCSPSKGHTVIVVSVGNTTTTTKKKSNEEIVKEVIAGKWGNGNARKSKLTKAGYDYEVIRAMVNKELKKK